MANFRGFFLAVTTRSEGDVVGEKHFSIKEEILIEKFLRLLRDQKLSVLILSQEILWEAFTERKNAGADEAGTGGVR